jgi:hypothetical protein
MVTCLESLDSANVSNIIQQAASQIPELGESENEGEFSTKIDVFHFQHSDAMETTQRDHLFAVMNRPSDYLACLKRVHLPLFQPRSWKLKNKDARNDDV